MIESLKTITDWISHAVSTFEHVDHNSTIVQFIYKLRVSSINKPSASFTCNGKVFCSASKANCLILNKCLQWSFSQVNGFVQDFVFGHYHLRGNMYWFGAADVREEGVWTNIDGSEFNTLVVLNFFEQENGFSVSITDWWYLQLRKNTF